MLDYLGAPYLRFSRAGVYVNENSEMYYLNYPRPLRLPAGLSKSTPVRWHRVSSAHEYEWHDGRLGGLADDAVPQGVSYLGRWRIPVLVNGRLSAIAGGLWHASSASIVWFWPIVVILACLLAAWRLHRGQLDALLLRALALLALAAVAVGAAGKELYGRPTVGTAELVPRIGACVRRWGWGEGTERAARACFAVRDFVRGAARGGGTALHADPRLRADPAARVRGARDDGPVLGVRSWNAPLPGPPPRLRGVVVQLAVVRHIVSASVFALVACVGLSGCGHPAPGRPRAGVDVRHSERFARRGSPDRPRPRFHPPPSGRSPAAARRGSGLELRSTSRSSPPTGRDRTGGDRRPLPLTSAASRILRARCYGPVVTLNRRASCSIRGGLRMRLSDVFHAWGQPLTSGRVASFGVRAEATVRVFIDGRLWPGEPGSVPVAPRAEIVVEIGPYVPPHSSLQVPADTMSA